MSPAFIQINTLHTHTYVYTLQLFYTATLYIIMYIKMFVLFIITVVPSCYVRTNCRGSTVGNSSTTFSECCTQLSGVSFELERQCRMCPASGMYTCMLIKLKYTCIYMHTL